MRTVNVLMSDDYATDKNSP